MCYDKATTPLVEKQYNTGRQFTIPCSRMTLFKKEVEQLMDIGVPKRQLEFDSEWGSQTFIIPKLNQIVVFYQC